MALLPVLAHADDALLQWTNTVRLSTLYQFNQIPLLGAEPCRYTANCGYGGGITQGRSDWLSQLDLDRDGVGLKASLEARKDAVEPASSYFELSEANLHGTFALAGRPLTLTLGRQSVIWGESQFFADNAISGAQAPIDATYGFDAMGYQSTTHFLPVGQVSAVWQIGASVTVMAYQQVEWRRNRIDPEDAYAGPADTLGAEGNRELYLGAGYYRPVRYDRLAGGTPAGTDQFGVGVKLRREEWDLGFYALQFDARTPAIVYDGSSDLYSLDYARAIGLVGASLAGPLGAATLGAEISARRHMPLVDRGIFASTGENGQPGPLGDTLHAQASLTLPIEPSSLLPGGGSWVTELAGNHLSEITANAAQLAPDRTRDAAALRSVATAPFFQVAPRIDLSLSVGLGWNFAGNSAVLTEMNRGTGDLSAGLGITFDRRWTASMTMTHYFGQDRILTPGYRGRPLSDWDRIGASLQTEF